VTTTVDSEIARAGADDGPGLDDAVEMIVRLHGRALYRFLLRITFGDRRESDDLFQETLLRAWRYLRDHDSDVPALLPLLYTIARRLAIDAARARQVRPVEVIVSDSCALPTGSDDIERLMVQLTIRRGLMSLAQGQREVIYEVYYRGSSAREVAEALGIPEGTVKSRLFYGLRAMRAMMQESLP
jgi:RNA polymerase sigma-70 factor (ECF subfamily)